MNTMNFTPGVSIIIWQRAIGITDTTAYCSKKIWKFEWFVDASVPSVHTVPLDNKITIFGIKMVKKPVY
jgi:hypothetical protein